MVTGNCEFDEVYEKYKNLVLRAAFLFSGNNYHVAEDIAQETFLNLYIAFDKVDKAKVESWLYTSARNKAINYKRKNSRITLIGDYNELGEREPTVSTTEEVYLKKELEAERYNFSEGILEALMKKNGKWYEAMILAYYMKLPQDTAAEIMKMNVESFHSLLYRARKWIAKKYGVEYEEVKQI